MSQIVHKQCKMIVIFLAGLVLAKEYALIENCYGKDFLECFDFFTGKDPTHGFVDYLNRTEAVSKGLVRSSPYNVTVSADSIHTVSRSSRGRPSVRLEARNAYTHGLYLFSLNHMPYGCATWPAFWTLGQGIWPGGGEIDIIEGVNVDPVNWATLHTTDNCTVAGVNQTGTLLTNDCASTTSTSGCVVEAKSTRTYGAAFNADRGGVYAMEWTSDFIRIWFFPRANTPGSIRSGTPRPEKDFGTPMANFQGSCNIDKHFRQHRAIIDLTFCGDWAGYTYRSAGCPMFNNNDSMSSCHSFVAERPGQFKEAYWDIEYLRVFQTRTSTSTRPPTSTVKSSVSPVASSGHISSISDAKGKSSSTHSTLSMTGGHTSSKTASSRPSSIHKSQTTSLRSTTITSHTSSKMHTTSKDGGTHASGGTSHSSSLRTSESNRHMSSTQHSGSTVNPPLAGSTAASRHTTSKSTTSGRAGPSDVVTRLQCERVFEPPPLAPTNISTSLRASATMTLSRAPSPLPDVRGLNQFHIYCSATLPHLPSTQVLTLTGQMANFTGYGADNVFVACLQVCASLPLRQCIGAVYTNGTDRTNGVRKCEMYGVPRPNDHTDMVFERNMTLSNATTLGGVGGNHTGYARTNVRMQASLGDKSGVSGVREMAAVGTITPQPKASSWVGLRVLYGEGNVVSAASLPVKVENDGDSLSTLSPPKATASNSGAIEEEDADVGISSEVPAREGEIQTETQTSTVFVTATVAPKECST